MNDQSVFTSSQAWPTNKQKALAASLSDAKLMTMCIRCLPRVGVEWTVLVHPIKTNWEGRRRRRRRRRRWRKKSSLKRSILYHKQATAYKRTYTKMFSMFYFSTMCPLQLLLLLSLLLLMLLLLSSCCFTNRPVVQPVACGARTGIRHVLECLPDETE